MQPGLFITFEGSEGGGKSTQIRRLASRLEALGRRVLLTREPGGTPIGEQIRHLLQHSEEGHGMKPEAELLLFAASRAQLAREVISPAVAAGTVVLADRFMDSTTVYQGVARAIDPEAVRFINQFAVGPCRPDLTLVLDVETGLGRKRMLARAGAPDRMEQEPTEFFEAVREGYLRLAQSEPKRIRVIDASRSIEEVEQEIWQSLQEQFDGIFAAHRP